MCSVLRGVMSSVCALSVLLTAVGLSAAETKSEIASAAPACTILDLAGKPHQVGANADRKAVVVVFLATECPIANGYIPELNRIAADIKQKQLDVAFYGVHSDRYITREDAAKHAQEYKIAFPVLFDASQELADVLKPQFTPEAFVLDLAGRVQYHGRIDDAYADLGQKRIQATTHELTDALAAVVAGKPVAKAYAEPVGCLFEGDPAAKITAKVNYTRDIAPILQAHCMNCHRPGEVAPFSLTNYDDARKRARQIARVANSRIMPPWKPETGFGHFLDERRLTPREIELLSAWAEAGAPQGNTVDLPAPPQFVDGWQLGEPDLVLKMPEPFEIHAEGRDIIRQFVIPIPITEDKLVAVAEFRPGNRRVVHHAIFYLDSTGAARLKDATDPGPGYATFGGPGIIPTGGLGGWSPGATPRFLPDNMGRQLKKGSDLVLQIHYHPSGKVEQDQSTVGVYFVKKPSTKIVGGIMVLDRGVDIPAGEKRHGMTGSYSLPMDLTIVGITPHMHLLGREMKVTATLPDGRIEPLVWIKDWNFNWQDQYMYAEPFVLPKGTRLDVAAYYDNSSDNPSNPSSPPQRVTWGEQTTDEMFICFFTVTMNRPQDLLPLILDNLQHGQKLRRAPR